MTSGLQALEAVEIEKTAAMVDQEWRSSNVGSLLNCLSSQIRTAAHARIIQAAVLHPDLTKVGARTVVVRLIFQPVKSSAPLVELEDIYEILTDRSEVELAVVGNYPSANDAQSNNKYQSGLEMQLLSALKVRAALR
jgi:hypothetical protein